MMKVSEALRVSYKNQFGIVNENYESSVLLDSLVMTTEEINETYREKHTNVISEQRAENKVKELRAKAKRIIDDLTKMSKRVS
jgi:hypothetical protein